MEDIHVPSILLVVKIGQDNIPTKTFANMARKVVTVVSLIQQKDVHLLPLYELIQGVLQHDINPVHNPQQFHTISYSS
jgi:hypothetical protein